MLLLQRQLAGPGVALSQGRPAGPRRSPTGATPKGRIRRSGVTRRSRLRSEIMWDARLDTLPSINRRHPDSRLVLTASPRLRNSWFAKTLGTYAFAGIYAGNCTTVPVPIARDF